MATSRSDHIQLADGHDNTAGLQRLDELSAGLLAEYRVAGGVLTEWHDAESWERNGNRDLVAIGLPWVELRLFNITPEERAMLATYEGEVTAHLYDKAAAAWGDYNGVLEMKVQDSKWEPVSDYWAEVKITIRDLVEIEAEPEP